MNSIKYISIFIIISTIIISRELTEIKIIGNSKTKDYIIKREIEHLIPNSYNSIIAEADKNRIYNLNLFSRVNIDTINNTYVIDVVEKFYFFPIPIFDYDETTGSSYGIAILNMNLRGRNETIACGFIKGKTDEYFLSYINPWIYGDHISFGFEFENLSHKHHAYEIIDYSNVLQVFSGFHIGSKHKFKFISGYTSHQLDDNLDISYKYFNARIKYKYDTRDIYLDPTSGTLINFKINNRIGLLNTENLYQFELDTYWYKSIINNYFNPVLKYRFNIYFQQSKESIPLFYKKYLGGNKLIRGYSSIPIENKDYAHNIEVDNYVLNSLTIQGTIIQRETFFSLFEKEIEIGNDFKLFIDYGFGARQKKYFNLNDSILGFGFGSIFFIEGSEINIDLAFNQSGNYRIHFYSSI